MDENLQTRLKNAINAVCVFPDPDPCWHDLMAVMRDIWRAMRDGEILLPRFRKGDRVAWRYGRTRVVHMSLPAYELEGEPEAGFEFEMCRLPPVPPAPAPHKYQLGDRVRVCDNSEMRRLGLANWCGYVTGHTNTLDENQVTFLRKDVRYLEDRDITTVG